jgi:protein TonB
MKNISVYLQAFAFLCMNQMAQAQALTTTLPPAYQVIEPFNAIENQNASFQGLNQYLSTRVDYPELARQQSIEGLVIAETLIGADGRVVKAHIKKGLGFGCDEAVLKLIKNMPHWQPARESGQAVCQIVFVPVRFSLR